MKLYIIAIGLALSPLFLVAQSKSIANFMEQFSDQSDGTSISLQGFSLNLVANFTKKNTSSEVVSKINQLRMLAFSENTPVTNTDVRQLLRQMKKDQFEELIEFRHEGKNVRFMIRDKGDWITHIVMLSKSEDSFVLISLEGKVHMDELDDLNINLDGGEPFGKVKV